ncbi:MAG: M28 family peptidase [Bacteroidales bacterium]|nr:M28 family peptidase [Bacteroidales bacterium]
MTKRIILYSLISLLLFSACQGKKKNNSTQRDNAPQTSIEFSADSAYRYIAEQVAFGPRTPASKAHEACGNYLVNKMKSFGAEVQEQKADIRAWDGKTLPMRNIIASFQPENAQRILLFAHWDCRPWSDMEKTKNLQMKAVLGANDGASGVGVLMEVARQLGKAQTLPVGVDIIFFDLEDYGVPDWGKDVKDSWCLGSQYWAKHPHKAGYTANYGILLDMVGTRNACFMWEYISKRYAPDVVQKVWNKAQELGYGQFFIQADGGILTDDHLYINTLAGIPSIDIIDFDNDRGGFFEGWHTQHDDMSNIDKLTLQAVGNTLMHIIYSE